jgi:hypothetical protein
MGNPVILVVSTVAGKNKKKKSLDGSAFEFIIYT